MLQPSGTAQYMLSFMTDPQHAAPALLTNPTSLAPSDPSPSTNPYSSLGRTTNTYVSSAMSSPF